jgi:hypothetical protein
MGQGVEDIGPYILEASKVQNIADLRIIPTDIIKEGSEIFLLISNSIEIYFLTFFD